MQHLGCAPPLGFRVAQQLQHEVGAGFAAGDVVLQVGVQPVVFRAQFRRQADDKGLQLDGCQPEQPAEARQRQVDTALCGCRCPGVDFGRHVCELCAEVRDGSVVGVLVVCSVAPGRRGQQRCGLAGGDIHGACELITGVGTFVDRGCLAPQPDS